ncbi:hypothetical protein ACIGZH_09005 [Streptomyces sp. NPDC058319]|uniref:hypothetical protein n=1 Tax=unclassified Streptomyces TaxID=2593676 RepID=UPI0036E5E834
MALVAAVFGAYLLNRAADVRPGTHTDTKDVTAAVHEQLHKMFLADLPPGSRVIRSGIVSADAPERINYPQGVLALRCYGDGHLGVSRIMMDGTKKKHANINCGRTALTLVASDATVRTILITPEGAGTWASWALAYSSSAPSA